MASKTENWLRTWKIDYELAPTWKIGPDLRVASGSQTTTFCACMYVYIGSAVGVVVPNIARNTQ